MPVNKNKTKTKHKNKNKSKTMTKTKTSFAPRNIFQVERREHLCQGFRCARVNSLSDYELLELLLFRAAPGSDVGPMAEILLKRFKTINGVLSAGKSELQVLKGICNRFVERITDEFALTRAIALRMAREEVIDRPVLSSWRSVIDYVIMAMGHNDIEQFKILFLDRKDKLITEETHQHGTIDHTPVYPREVMRRALETGASALVLVHNHPSGDPSPSRSDIDMTRNLIAIAQPLGISIHDHLVVAQGQYASFRELGII